MKKETKETVAAQALPELLEEDAVVYEALRAKGADKPLAHNATLRIRAMAAANVVATVQAMRQELISFKEEVRHRFGAASGGLEAFRDAAWDRLAGTQEELRSLKNDVHIRFERVESEMRSFKEEVRARFERVESEMRSFKEEVRGRFERVESEMRGGFEAAARDRDSLRGLIRNLSQRVESIETLNEARYDATRRELATMKWAMGLVIAMLAALIALVVPVVQGQKASPAIPATAGAVGVEGPSVAGESASADSASGASQSGASGGASLVGESEPLGR
ncbi:MAG: hypothetical protein OXN89_00180 [Bryobacterales bacterium]|nr:hypothetical protein [Bryobacterales bacterium]